MSGVGTAVVQYIIDARGSGFTYLFLGLVVLAVSPFVSASPPVSASPSEVPKWREEKYKRFEQASASKSLKPDGESVKILPNSV